MNLQNTKLLMYNLLAMIKLAALIILFFGGFILLVSEPIKTDNEMYCLVLSKAIAMIALYTAYRIFNGSLNRLNE
jgi:hypothetical protein